MLQFLNELQAASLLGCTLEELQELVQRGELTKEFDGIPGDQVALYLLEREQTPG